MTPGTRVELVRTSDIYTMLRPGERGTVQRSGVHDRCRVIDVNWDNGSTLSMLIDEGDVIVEVTP